MKNFVFLVCFFLSQALSANSSCSPDKARQISVESFPDRPMGGILWFRIAGTEKADRIDRVAAAVYWNKRLRIELFSLSTNTHTLLKADQHRDRELKNRAIASFVSKALMDLRTMEYADEIVTSATLKAVKRNLKNIDCDEESSLDLLDIEELFHDFLVIINDTMSASGVPLFQEWRYASELDSLPSDLPDEPDDNYLTMQQEPKWPMNGDSVDFEEPILRRALFNKVFLDEASVVRGCYGCSNEDLDEHVDYFLARGMMELAKESDRGEELNSIYQQALTSAVSMNHPWSADRTTVKNKLFAALMTNFVEGTELDAILERSMVEVASRWAYLCSVSKNTPV